jgi:hypothetical protein
MKSDDDRAAEMVEAFRPMADAAAKVTTKTRAQHLAWCKERATAYLHEGDTDQAFASMLSDLQKHPETRGHSAIQLGVMMRMGGHLNTVAQMQRFVDGFN